MDWANAASACQVNKTRLKSKTAANPAKKINPVTTFAWKEYYDAKLVFSKAEPSGCLAF